MKTIDLTPFKNELSNEELQQEYEIGEIVEVEQGVGMIAAFAESTFEYPVGVSDRVDRIEEEDEDIEMEEIEASEDNPVYIIALQEGGSVAATAEEIDTDASFEDDDGVTIESWDDVEGEAGEAELAPIYSYMDNPDSREELEKVKLRMIHEQQAEHLANFVESGELSLEELNHYSYEELVNIPGVDDPHVGFDELPPGWTRKSVLQAWASLGGLWRTCYARMVREMGPRFARRWCSALKDEVLRTEEWRGKF